jgi:hypothetical protein
LDSPTPTHIERQLDALRVALVTLYRDRPIEAVYVRVGGVRELVRVPFPAEPYDPPAPVPTASPEPEPDLSGLPELGREILQALEENGGWMTGAELAQAIGGDCDHTSGTWRRTTRMLKGLDTIETDYHRGYCLKSKQK